MFSLSNLSATVAHHSDRLQKFTDTRFGWTATLRLVPAEGFVLRIRQDDGMLRHKETFPTAHMAKSFLDQVLIVVPGNYPDGMRGNWWTVSGNVCDITD